MLPANEEQKVKTKIEEIKKNKSKESENTRIVLVSCVVNMVVDHANWLRHLLIIVKARLHASIIDKACKNLVFSVSVKFFESLNETVIF